MKTAMLTRNELETRVERAFENACAYCAGGNFRLMYLYWGEANAYMDMLEDMYVYIDEENEHVAGMLEALQDMNGKLTITRI